MINDLNNLDKSDMSDINKTNIEELVATLKTLQSQISAGLPNLDDLINFLKTLTLDNYKTTDNTTTFDNLMANYTGSNGIFTNINVISDYMTSLNGVVDWDNINGYSTYQEFFTNSDSPFLIAFVTSDAQAKYGNSAIGLNSLAPYIEVNDRGTFFGIQFIYCFIYGMSMSDVGNQWQSYHYTVFTTSQDVRIVFGFVFIVISLVFIILLVWWLTKRMIELLIYFLISPVFVAAAVLDEGAKLGAWFKLVIGKMFSLFVLQVCFGAFFILQPVIQDIAENANTGLSGNLLGISNSTILKVSFI